MDSPISFGPDNFAVRSAPTARRSRWRAMRGIALSEAVKYGIVGLSGIGVNLLVMAVILHQTTLRDWRASLVASIVSTMSNYTWNNFWTFRHRAHGGLTFFRRYVTYLAVSLLGLAVTTIIYAVSSHALGSTLQRRQIASMVPISGLLLCQLVAILAGTLFNYVLNRTFTWPHPEPR